MRAWRCGLLMLAGTFALLVTLHFPFLPLPYFWDEAGYYIPAALDFYHSWLLIPQSTLTTGHTPLVPVYLATAWRVFGYSPVVTRVAMLLLAAATVMALYALARLVAERETAFWGCLLLALSPLFFAQSTLAHLDLVAGLFTVLAVTALLQRNMPLFAFTASLTILSKETAVVLLPVAWLFAWRMRIVGARHGVPLQKAWAWLSAPLLPLLAWAIYYHHSTGYWTGNSEYLQYNLYSTLSPLRVFFTLLRRLYELLIGGFNWLLVLGASLAICKGAKSQPEDPSAVAAVSDRRKSSALAERRYSSAEERRRLRRELFFLAGGLCGVYVLMLSVVGGAILPRYLLPALPLFYLLAVLVVSRLRPRIARSIYVVVAACFVWAWFINPPYPFPFEDNLAYADFVRLHQQAAQFLTERSNPARAARGEPRILTAWPACDELTRPFLGYVQKPLQVVSVRGFTPGDFDAVAPASFDLLYLYSRKWAPHNNWLEQFPQLEKMQEHYFDYAPQVRSEVLVTRFNLKLLAQFERRGQWVRIYSK